MKKNLMLAPFLAALLALSMISCELAPSGSPGIDSSTLFAQYSADGSRVTLNLDGFGDTESGRALSRPLAQEAYDFLEVVFMSNDGANDVIARASWEKGKAMSITGVWRGTSADPVNYFTTGGATVSDTVGNAVLFVGRKAGNDLILLAVGKIIEIDGVPVSTAATISPDTKNVTFGLAALTCNTIFTSDSPNTGGSFAANPAADITISQLNVVSGRPDITLYQLTTTVPVAPKNITATYTLGSSGGTILPIADMIPAIIADVSTSPPVVGGWTEGFKLTEPLYLLPNGETRGFNAYKPALVSGAIGTAVTDDTAIPSAIPIDITVPIGAEGVTSFFFSIPVVAITKDDSTAAIPIPAKKWLVRPGIDVYHLDDGTANSVGSAIFISASLSALDALTLGYK